jgi:hypothetical protein
MNESAEGAMKFTTPPVVIRVGMPAMFFIWICLFFQGIAPQYWLISLPLLLLLGFMNTLADVHDAGHRLRIKRWWKSMDVPKREITRIGPSFLDGIGVIEFRRFVFPWGRIYFVAEWSNVESADAEPGKTSSTDERTPHGFFLDVVAAISLAVSGFVSARAVSTNTPDFRIQTSSARVEAFIVIGALCLLYAIARVKRQSWANVVLYIATWIGGLAHT